MNEPKTKEEILKADRTKMMSAVDNFAAEMKARLLQKQREGRHGWDDPVWHDFHKQKLMEDAEKLNLGDADVEVDIAVRAMFSHHLKNYH